MESPVRILFGAAIVVTLLLLDSTTRVTALNDSTTITTRLEKSPRNRNITWTHRGRPKTPDLALNELNPKSSASEENADRNSKYKDRGRIRYSQHATSSTESPKRRKLTTEAASSPKIMIVTPTPPKKNMTEIIDSMRKYKNTKLPYLVSSTTPVTTLKKDDDDGSDEFDSDEDHDHDHDDDFEKFTTSNFHDNDFFTIPSFEDEFGHDHDLHDSVKDSTNNNHNYKGYSIPSYSKYSSYFPKEISYKPKDDDDEPFKSSYFNFDTELTTPRNEFFDKKYKRISSSIIKNIDSSKSASASTTQVVPQKMRTENGDMKIIQTGTPNNKSTVIIKNTKEIRVSDNEGAGTTNKELSDTVHGTSIYYEMSVLSTETYGIDHDDDCDNDTAGFQPTPSTTKDQELASIKTTIPMSYGPSNKPITVETKSEIVSTASSSYNPTGYISSPIASSVSSFWASSQNSILSTEKTARFHVGNQNNKNRGYTKRYNYSSTKDPYTYTTTIRFEDSSKPKLSTRRFQYSTPKTKPVWMAPKRNVTRKYNRTPTSTTIYQEYFEVQNKPATTKRTPSRTVLTTVSSDIDPVLQSELGASKKLVNSHSASDNSISTLWKRGSTKYTTTSASATTPDDKVVSEMEIPPTLAMALASLRSPPGPHGLITPPTSGNIANNETSNPSRNVDENELQRVGEFIESRESTTGSTAAITVGFSNEDTSKKIVDIDQNRLVLRPVIPLTTAKIETESSVKERQPAESNISQTTVPPITEPFVEKLTTSEDNYYTETITQTTTWIPVNGSGNEFIPEATEESTNDDHPPYVPTRSFESITKIPSRVTTLSPDENPRVSSYKTDYRTELTTHNPSTTDYEVTTIRFTYIPTITEEITHAETTERPTTESEWVPVAPTRTKLTTIEDGPVTTYRPYYSTSDEETATESPSTTPIQTESTTLKERSTTDSKENEYRSTTLESKSTTDFTQDHTTEDRTTHQETSTMIVQVVTEINSERNQPDTQFTTTPMSEFTELSTADDSYSKEVSKSEENSDSNEVITQQPRVHTDPPTDATTQTDEIKTTQTYTTTQQEIKTTEENPPTTTTQQEQGTTVIKDDVSTEFSSTAVDDDLTTSKDDVTTEASSRVLGAEEAGTGPAVAIAVSTIGVIALILLIGLLLVVRRRGRRGQYAKRITPLSLDAYSLDSVTVGHRKDRPRTSRRSYGNPAFEDEVTSHPMQYAALANFALDVESMTAEFGEIPTVTVKPDEVPPGCEDKNRYSNVLPLPETRVPLKRIGNDPTTEYINANYITGPGNLKNYYILAQAPLSNTVADFWRMMWEQNSRVIVMLTEYMENGVEKCYEYLPPSEVSDNRRVFGDFQIILKKREQRDKYAVSTLQFINQKTRTWREITHLWYFWPAKGVPDDYESIIEFLSEMRGYMKMSQTAKEYDDEGIEVVYGDQSRSTLSSLSNLRSDEAGSYGLGLNVYSPQRAEEQLKRGTNGTLGRMKTASEVDGGVRPMVVVCASGAGRSAAVVCLDVCGRAVAAGAVDVPRVVREVRAQRPHALSNKHHYILLYKVLSEYGNKLMGGVDTI